METFVIEKEDIESIEILDNNDYEVYDLTVEGNSNFFLKTNDKNILVHNSGKSFVESCFIPLAVDQYQHRVLYTRYTMNSTDQSINQALEDRMDMLGLSGKFEYANHTYQHKHHKGRIFITGQKTSSLNQTAKLKSLEDFSIFVTDEAEEIKTYEEWDKIRKSIRAKDVQCLSMLVFNPPTREHWLYTELFEDKGVIEGFSGVKDNILYIHSTYLDNLDYVAEHNLKEFEMLRLAYEEYYELPKEQRDSFPKLKKKASKYKHVVLGGFKEKEEGVIYDDWSIGEFNHSLTYCYGLDFGFDDPDALIKVAVDHKQKKIYLDEILYQNGLGTPQLGTILLDICGYTDMIIADAAHKRLINDLYQLGLNIRRSKKGAGSVAQGIKTIQGYELVVTKSSVNIIKSLNNYVWHNERSGVPKHDFSHIPDAFRYAAMDLINY